MWTAAALALLVFAAPDLEIPTGKPVALDGEVGEAEWADAKRFPGQDHDLRLKRSGGWLLLGLEGRRAYSGEIVYLTISDAAGAWQTLYMAMIGQPAQPPALLFRGSREQYLKVSSDAKVPMEAARGTICRVRVREPGAWSAEYRIRLTSLGIGRGDRREFRARLVFADGLAGRGDILVVPAGTTPRSEVSEYARLTSPDGWGAEERWPPVRPEESLEFDDAGILGLLALEQQEALPEGEIGELVIRTVVRPRNRERVAKLRARLEAGRARNPGLPAWRFYLARLLHEANVYDDAGELIDSIPEPLRGFGAFAHLSAEHYTETGRPEKALALCREFPRVYGIARAFQQARTVERMLEAERKLDEAAARAAPLPVVRFTTEQGSFEVELFEDHAPNAATNLVDLVLRRQYYDGMQFFGVHGNVGARLGDPRTKSADGAGPDGPPWRVRSDASERQPLTGRLVTVPIQEGGHHGSQFSLTLAPVTHDLHGAVVFGRVVKGLDVVLSLEEGDRIKEAIVVRKRSHKYDPAPVRME